MEPAAATYLTIEAGPNSGQVHRIEGDSVTVGRGGECGVQLLDLFVSRQHFRIERRDQEWWLVDSGSKNCTAVNGVPAARKLLAWGDEIRVGDTRLIFLPGGPERGAPPQDSRPKRRTSTLSGDHRRHDMVGSSPAMRGVYEMIEKVAPLDVTVLITGESGTGKELVARAIHRNSPRFGGPFVAVNCAAIPEGLADSELFGHERGAFTGAQASRPGCFEQAHGGTLFLDEIGELPAESQARLLRVLEDRRVTRLGGRAPVEVDVRFLSASNQPLRALSAAGRFRQDLLFRLEVVAIEIPPLRERPGDIPELARFFLEHYRRQTGRRLTGFSPEALRALAAHPWPGNVRELKNTIERAVITGRASTIGAEDIDLGTVRRAPAGVEPLSAVEKRHVERAMAAADGNKMKAAQILGIPRSTLYDKLKEHGLD